MVSLVRLRFQFLFGIKAIRPCLLNLDFTLHCIKEPCCCLVKILPFSGIGIVKKFERQDSPKLNPTFRKEPRGWRGRVTDEKGDIGLYKAETLFGVPHIMTRDMSCLVPPPVLGYETG